jgi:protein-L-isoaspartate(D-aspartate) O-methyltransferase
MPVGPLDGVQRLIRMQRTADGFDERELANVRFVPLIPGIAARL